jgi:hypothetical protein
MLACEAPPCTFLFAAQTLDDRVEMFAPETDAPYRGTIDVDLKPNPGGDNSGENLDEPYEMVAASGALHVAVGHFPSRDRGSLLSFSWDFFEARTVGEFLPTSTYAPGGTFLDIVVERPLERLEPIWFSRRSSHLLVAVFENDLFKAESTWTTPGSLLVVDLADPAAAVGVRTLDDVDGAACAGAAEIVELADDRIAVACDGNEAVAILDVSSVGSGDPQAAADSITPVGLCDLGPTDSVRVRHLTSAGAGAGFVVLESPIGATTDPARAWAYDAECTVAAFATIGDGLPGTLTGVASLPGSPERFLVTGTIGRRGVWVLTPSGTSFDVCPLPGIDTAFEASDGSDLEPLALAVTPEGDAMALGLGPFAAVADAPGFGRVLWVRLGPGGACDLQATEVVDLTDGSAGHAPLEAADSPATWRRAPAVLALHRVE